MTIRTPERPSTAANTESTARVRLSKEEEQEEEEWL